MTSTTPLPMRPTTPRSTSDRTTVWRPPDLPGVELGVKSSPVGLEFPPAPVPDLRVVVNGPGRCDVRFGHQALRLSDATGSVFLQAPGEVFAGTFDADGLNGTYGRCVGIGAETWTWLDDAQPPRFAPGLLDTPAAATEMARRVDAVERSMRDTAPLLARQTTVLDLLSALVALVSPRSAAAVTGREHRAVRLVQDRIADQLEQDHSLVDLGRLTGLHPRSVLRAFRRHTGTTPHRYLTGLRVQRAKDLLVGDQPIAEVAVRTGFSDQAHLTRVFKQYVHVTPGQFRRDSR
ncbi:MAG: helix-turn-helix domain-containing protein [Dermatophilaceae bacterium]